MTAQAKATLANAIALLPESVRKRIRKVRLVANPDPKRAAGLRRSKPETEGQTEPGDDAISIVADSNVFLAAEGGDVNALTKVASIVVHENWHLENGPSEGGAYAAQLDVLHQMNADKGTIRDVERARDSVVSR